MASSPHGIPRAHVALAALSPGDVTPIWESSPQVEGTTAVPRARFIVDHQHPASAGPARADLSGMAAVKFSMCRLEAKCN